MSVGAHDQERPAHDQERPAHDRERPADERPRDIELRAVIVFAVVSLAIGLLAFDLSGGVVAVARRPASVTLRLAAGWTLAAIFFTWLACGRAVAVLGRRSPVRALGAVGCPLALLGWTQVFHGTYAEPFEQLGDRCLAVTLLVAAAPLTGFLLLRRSAGAHPTALGAAGGAMAGAWAAVVVGVSCPLSAPAHTLFGHVAPVALVVAGGALLGRKLLGAR